ncbi:MAG: sulfatase-like hydrolase/transferase [Bryobacterales bacterium]|nr:sulfatase-like hydrolase/transferase [Bryobacterales bacterium]
MAWTRRNFLSSIAAAALPARAAAPRINVVFVFVDDLGYGDLGVTGNRDVPTPNMDRLARNGIRFTQFTVASPICSPSRTGVLTGQFPARHRIHSYLSDRKSNAAVEMPDWLDPEAPSVARAFQQAGYRTAHVGKWHLGGGRDVGDAPLPQAYGFEESLTSFEGLGDRLLIENDGLSKQSAALGNGEVTWAPKHRLTELYVDRAIEFMKRAGPEPFYLHLWPCDVHDAHIPREDLLAKYERFSKNPYQQKFYAVLDEFDRQMGRLLDWLDASGLAANTLVALTGDNGPTAWPRYYKEGFVPPGSTAGDRGRKWSLYEGGIRQPFLARLPGVIPAGRVDTETVFTSVDLMPTFCAMAGVTPPRDEADGEDMSRALKGKTQRRKKPIFWSYTAKGAPQPGLEIDQSPSLAMREGEWKLLMNPDGSRMEFYDLSTSPAEDANQAETHKKRARRMAAQLSAWNASLPVLKPG